MIRSILNPTALFTVLSELQNCKYTQIEIMIDFNSLTLKVENELFLVLVVSDTVSGINVITQR